ncbi:MAG: hypothetical protein IPH08_10460 [Rhodocyclaceae bacterium]|nr:hypothetical protein [Rhodocyclaceae bacterium]
MTICDAIKGKSLLSFIYHGHPRIVQPHTYGIDEKGHKALRAYQIGGTSDSGRIPAWRIFHEADIKSLTISTERFSAPHHEYKRDDKFFATILCQL